MAVKLAHLTSLKRIRHWVSLFACLSSIPCRVDVEILQESRRDSPNSPGCYSIVKSLKKELGPDSLIRVLGSTPDIESSVRIFRWAGLQKRFQHTAGTYGAMILKLGLSGNVEEMEGFCQNMIRDRCPGAEVALISLIEKFVEHSRTNAAIRVLSSMTAGGFRPATELFDAVLGAAVAEKRELKDVIFVYKEMVKAGRAPTINTLNHLLEALFEAGWVDSALDQYRRMNKKRCNPNNRTYDILIKNLIMKGRVDDAVVMLREMLGLGIEMDSGFYNCVIPLLCRENKLAEALVLFRKMRASNYGPEPSVYMTLIHRLCSNLLLDEGRYLLEEMIDSGIAPSEDVLQDMVVGYCKTRKIPEAIELLEDKEVLATSPHNALLSGCCGVGDYHLAKELLDRMHERDIADCDSWNILIRWLCEHSKLEEALQVLKRMIVASFIPNSSTHSALILGFCGLGKPDKAMKLFHRVRESCWVLDSLSYSRLIDSLCEMGKSLEAAEVFCYMSVEKHCLESSSFNKLLKGVSDARGFHEARHLLSLAAGCHTYFSDETYIIMLNGLSENPKHQLIVLAQMLVRGFKISSEAYTILIRGAWNLSDRAKEAALLFNIMVAEGLVPQSGSLLDLLSKFGSRSQMHMIFGSIYKLLLMPGVVDSDMYSLLITGLWKEGNKGKARELLDLMLEKGWIPDFTTHGLFIEPTPIQETNQRKLESDNFVVQDNISSILSEGLGRI